MNSILKIPIQINGGNVLPSTLNPRELFLHSNGRLHYGDRDGNVVPIISSRVFCTNNNAEVEVGFQSGTEGVGAGTGSDEKVIFRFGHCRYHFGNRTLYCDCLSKQTGKNGGFERNDTYASSIKGVNEFQGNLLRSQKIILSKNSSGVSGAYGNTLPTSAQEGQLFFKIIE